MSNYIKREDAIKCLADYLLDHSGTSTINHAKKASVILNTVPSADVVEVVRCKDCKWYEDENHKIYENCVKWKNSHGIILPVDPVDFCSYGERRSDE